MGALTDQRKRSSTELYSSPPKKPRLMPPPSSPPTSPNLPPPFRRPIHAPQRTVRAFGLGSSPSKRWSPSSDFFSPPPDRKRRHERLGLEEYKKLVDDVVELRRKSPELVAGDEAEILDGLGVREKVEEGGVKALELGQMRARKKPVYKELYEKAKESDLRLNSLGFEAKVLQQKKLGLCFEAEARRKKEEKPKEELELFRPLTAEEEREISVALFSGSSRKVLVAHEPSNIEITREVLQCLKPGAWLNDEIINLYLELLKEREKREPKKFLKCHFFNTFFYKRLISEKHGYDFKAVKRWTTQRKLGYALTECDKIFVPIHKEIHWCLAVINVKDKSFQYLDSLGGLDNYALKMLARYLKDEIRDKSGKEIDTLSWKKESVEELPLQKNGWDCGMFMLKYADFYSRGLKLCFNQEHMSYFRNRTILDILRLKVG